MDGRAERAKHVLVELVQDKFPETTRHEIFRIIRDEIGPTLKRPHSTWEISTLVIAYLERSPGTDAES